MGGDCRRGGDGVGYRLDFVLPEGPLVIGEKGERLDKIDKDEAQKREVCRCCGDRVRWVKWSEGPAEAGEGCWGGEIADFGGDLAGKEVLHIVLCDHR